MIVIIALVRKLYLWVMIVRQIVFKIGMLINKIALSVDKETYNKIKPILDELEKCIIALVESEEYE